MLRTGVVWKSGYWCWWVSSRSGWLLELLTELIISFKMCQTVWKVSLQSGKFWAVWRVSSVENFRTVWKISGQYGKFPDSPKTFQTVLKVSWHVFRGKCGMYAKVIYALLTHFWRKKTIYALCWVFDILPTGKICFCVSAWFPINFQISKSLFYCFLAIDIIFRILPWTFMRVSFFSPKMLFYISFHHNACLCQHW